MWPTFFIPFPGGLDLVDVGGPGCNTHTIYYTPSTDTPDAKAGNLCVLIVTSDSEGSSTRMCNITPSTGWNRLYQGSNNDNYTRQYGDLAIEIFWRKLSQSDLSTTWTIKHGSAQTAIYELCSRVYIFKDWNENIPFDCFSYGCSYGYISTSSTPDSIQRFSGLGGSSLANGVGDWQLCITTALVNSGSTGDTFLYDKVEELGETLEDYWTSVLRNTGYSDTLHVSTGLRKTTAAVRNLFTGESVQEILTDWTGTALASFEKGVTTANTPKYPVAILTSNTISGLHYAEIEVSLTAGEKYSWYTGLQCNSGIIRYTGIAVTPPSGSSNEFGFIATSSTPTPRILTVNEEVATTGINDPQGGLNTWWFGGVSNMGYDGSPSLHIQPACLLFTAQETGTHKFRIYVGGGYSWAGLAHATTKTARVSTTCLLEGYVSPVWMPSDPADAGKLAKLQPHRVFYNKDAAAAWAQNSPVATMAVCINQKANPGPAFFVPYCGTLFEPIEYSADGLSVVDGGAIGNPANAGEGGSSICSRIVYPTKDGSAQQYYAEFEIDSLAGSATDWHRIIVQPLHGNGLDYEHGSGMLAEQYGWGRSTGTFYNPTNTAYAVSPWSASAGDKLGVLVDYVNSQIIWYKNGVAKGTIPMTTAAGREHEKLPFVLLIAHAISTTQYFYWTANLTNPTYLPNGALAWDWPNS